MFSTLRRKKSVTLTMFLQCPYHFKVSQKMKFLLPFPLYQRPKGTPNPHTRGPMRIYLVLSQIVKSDKGIHCSVSPITFREETRLRPSALLRRAVSVADVSEGDLWLVEVRSFSRYPSDWEKQHEEHSCILHAWVSYGAGL